MAKLRVYIDTSVFGGFFDDEFSHSSRAFFDFLAQGRAIALLSDSLVAELAAAPERVQDLLERSLTFDTERVEVTPEAEALRDAYIGNAVLPPRWSEDALHVAQATLSRADVIVSWNFRHLVNPVRIQGFSRVNALRGFGPVVILTPEDVNRNWMEEEDEQVSEDL
jgi:predicted nucleic acid-binding protein